MSESPITATRRHAGRLGNDLMRTCSPRIAGADTRAGVGVLERGGGHGTCRVVRAGGDTGCPHESEHESC